MASPLYSEENWGSDWGSVPWGSFCTALARSFRPNFRCQVLDTGWRAPALKVSHNDLTGVALKASPPQNEEKPKLHGARRSQGPNRSDVLKVPWPGPPTFRPQRRRDRRAALSRLRPRPPRLSVRPRLQRKPEAKAVPASPRLRTRWSWRLRRMGEKMAEEE